MLDFYFGSVVVWFIILVSSAIVCRKAIVKKGWIEISKKPAILRSLVFTLAIAAIPVFRFLICAFIFFMAFESKEDYIKTKDDGNERPREN